MVNGGRAKYPKRAMQFISRGFILLPVGIFILSPEKITLGTLIANIIWAGFILYGLKDFKYIDNYFIKARRINFIYFPVSFANMCMGYIFEDVYIFKIIGGVIIISASAGAAYYIFKGLQKIALDNIRLDLFVYAFLAKGIYAGISAVNVVLIFFGKTAVIGFIAQFISSVCVALILRKANRELPYYIEIKD